MRISTYNAFTSAIFDAKEALRNAPIVHTETWQGVEIASKPEMAMHEATDIAFRVAPHVGPQEGAIEFLQRSIKPNLPWAEDHFRERVCGQPLNPGKTWETWPYNQSADKFRNPQTGQFNHNYMERYWPKYAGRTKDGTISADPLDLTFHPPRQGIRYTYGDLEDVVALLKREPTTRQAYLPIFFPEDTGATHGDRVPCTLGYWFLQRADWLHITYHIRSCDFVRHFRDDIYLTMRLLLWMLERLRLEDARWATVRPGYFTMWIGSLHCFRNDHHIMFTPQPRRG